MLWLIITKDKINVNLIWLLRYEEYDSNQWVCRAHDKMCEFAPCRRLTKTNSQSAFGPLVIAYQCQNVERWRGDLSIVPIPFVTRMEKCLQLKVPSRIISVDPSHAWNLRWIGAQMAWWRFNHHKRISRHRSFMKHFTSPAPDQLLRCAVTWSTLWPTAFWIQPMLSTSKAPGKDNAVELVIFALPAKA